MTPFKTKNSGEEKVPCGKCPECRAGRASGWSFRLMQQDKISNHSHFITLTYDTTNVPITPRGFMDLRRQDIQLFIKRLRKSQGKVTRKKHGASNIKYYVCGEYGTLNWRPHYHAIIFNVRMELLQDAWGLGEIHYGNVSGASVGYTLKYISKPGRVPQHKNDDRQKEFSLMSKGLGANYLTPKMVKWHKNDLENRMHLNLQGGKKCAMPRYYKNKLYSDQEKEILKQANLERTLRDIAAGYTKSDHTTEPKRKAAIIEAFKKMNSPDKTKKL
ncbi:replication initiator protein [Blackfly microvirus SF02]|uniref:Replication initiator protein n=1 Tax=Blackfly microvirus SF02 TaxID=2576452 RepID=A0A4P8PJW6_9VIRU|nr:replication initiator protein [Blackfly microvirus SF02]